MCSFQDHRDATTRQMRQDGLDIAVELHRASLGDFFERVPYDRTGLVLIDLDRVGRLLTAIVRP